MEHTANYQLSQWEKTDRIQMEDFNGDNAKVEAALTALAAADTALQQALAGLGGRICTRTYVGEGLENRTVVLPGRPLFVMISGTSDHLVSLPASGKALVNPLNTNSLITLPCGSNDHAFWWDAIHCNHKNVTYQVFAILAE